jgi:hypothetical protein
VHVRGIAETDVRVSRAATRAYHNYQTPEATPRFMLISRVLTNTCHAPNVRDFGDGAHERGARRAYFAFPLGVRQVFGTNDACRDKCSVLCGDGSCKLRP